MLCEVSFLIEQCPNLWLRQHKWFIRLDVQQPHGYCNVHLWLLCCLSLLQDAELVLSGLQFLLHG